MKGIKVIFLLAAFVILLSSTPEARPKASEIIDPLASQSGSIIQVHLDKPQRYAEGSTLILEGVQVEYAGDKSLQYIWAISSGPKDKINLQVEDPLKPRLTLLDVSEPTDFVLQLTVRDGSSKAQAEQKVTAVPAKLKKLAQTGGPWTELKPYGQHWIAAQGSRIHFLDFNGKIKFTASLDNPMMAWLSTHPSPRPAILVQSPSRQWTMLQWDPDSGLRQIKLPMLGNKILKATPLLLEDKPFMLAQVGKNLELWNLEDPKRPRLKVSLKTPFKNARHWTFLDRHLYLAEAGTIHMLEAATGQLVASIPTGGLITSLHILQDQNKKFLIASLSQTAAAPKPLDFGLRRFEITRGGRLGKETRLAAGLNIRRAKLIPGTTRLLMAVETEKDFSLKMLDLKTEQKITLQLNPANLTFPLERFELNSVGKDLYLGMAQNLKIESLKLKHKGEAKPGYEISKAFALPTLLSAAWILPHPGSTHIWVGDEGTINGGGLGQLSESFKVKSQQASPSLFPVAAHLSQNGSSGALLYLSTNPDQLPANSPEGALALMSGENLKQVELSPLALGSKNSLRPLGLATYQDETKLKIVIAMARVSGKVSGSGLVIINKAEKISAEEFLKNDFIKTAQLIPLEDARDVSLSPNGTSAVVAAGTYGVVAIDLKKNKAVARMSLQSKEWFADRVILSHQGNMVLASFINAATRQAIIKIFGYGKDLQMQEYATLTGFKAIQTLEGIRAPRLALTEDDLYLFAPHDGKLKVFNMTNPAAPLQIIETAEADFSSEVRGVSVANRFKDVFVALGGEGVGWLEFGF